MPATPDRLVVTVRTRKELDAALDKAILVVGEDGAENITKFPFGPEYNIVGA